jgi:hypothetical protein
MVDNDEKGSRMPSGTTKEARCRRGRQRLLILYGRWPPIISMFATSCAKGAMNDLVDVKDHQLRAMRALDVVGDDKCE